MWLVCLAILAVAILVPFLCVAVFNDQNQITAGMDRYCTQILKGIAIVIIVVCHCMGIYGKGVTYFTPLGGIGVAMFLLLSAFGLNESWKKNGSNCWWRKRIVTVFAPYLIAQLCLYWSVRNFAITSFLEDVFLLRPKYVYGWYLNYLLLWYILFYIVMRLAILRKHKVIVFAIMSIVLFFISDEIRAEQAFSFVAGIVLSEYKDNNKYLNWKNGLALVAVGVLFLAGKQLQIVRQAPSVVYNLVQLMIKLPCALGICFVVPTLIRLINMRYFYYVGAVAYELYLVHGHVLRFVPATILGEILFLAVSAGIAMLFWGVMKWKIKAKSKLLKIR